MAFEHRFLQLLELPTSAASSSVFLSQIIQDKLLFDGKIHGVIRPDLPPRSFLSTIFPALGVGTGKSSSMRKLKLPGDALRRKESEIGSLVEKNVQQSSCWQVRTIAAQLRSRQEISQCLVTSAQEVNNSASGGSLLLVSGGHPVRRFPLVDHLLPVSSFHMLRIASKLRQSGQIPAGVQLWAVENPLQNTVERLERKVLAGAEVIILQPPLLLDQFSDWWTDASSRRLVEAVRIVVGLPLITSARSLQFWFGLTQTSGKEADARLAQLRSVEDVYHGDEGALSAFYNLETLNLMKYIKSLPGVAGIHYMPVTPSGWRQFAALRERNSS